MELKDVFVLERRELFYKIILEKVKKRFQMEEKNISDIFFAWR